MENENRRHPDYYPMPDGCKNIPAETWRLPEPPENAGPEYAENREKLLRTLFEVIFSNVHAV